MAQSKSPAIEVEGRRYEFCTVDCLILFVAKEGAFLR